MAVKGLKTCVPVRLCAVFCPIDILPHSDPVGHRKGRQMAAFRSTTGQHMALGDKVCAFVCVRVSILPCMSGGS